MLRKAIWHYIIIYNLSHIYNYIHIFSNVEENTRNKLGQLKKVVIKTTEPNFKNGQNNIFLIQLKMVPIQFNVQFVKRGAGNQSRDRKDINNITLCTNGDQKPVPEGVKMELRGKKDERTHERRQRAESDSVSPLSLMPENGEILGNASPGQGSRDGWMDGWMWDRDGDASPGKHRNFCFQLFKSKR